MGTNVTLRSPINPIQPGAYSVLDTSALIAPPGPGLPIPAIIGAALGGTPNVANYFRDAQALKTVLRGGAAFDCARFALSGNGGPVAVVRAGAPVQGFLALAGATGTPIKLTAKDYGSWTNSIKVTVAANNLVTISYTDALGVTYTESFAVGNAATLQNIADAINGNTIGFSASSFVTATVQAGTAPLAVVAQTPLASGSDGSALVSGDWTTALTVLETEPVTFVIPATGDATVHAQVLTHCNNMSQPLARKERVALGGAVLGESVAAQVTRMASLRDKRFQLVYPGIQDFDATGLLTTWDPFYAAAKVAGLHAALPDEATSLCHKTIDVPDVEKRLSTLVGSDIDTLLQAGVTPIAPAPRAGFWIVDSLSGWTTDDTFRDFHKIRSADTVAIRARVQLEAAFVGSKVLDSTVADIANEAKGVLSNLLNEGVIRAYQDPIVQNGPNARTFQVSLPVMLPDTVKFILISVALQPASTVNRTAPVADDALTF